MTTPPTVRRCDAADFDEWFALFEQVAAEGTGIGAEAPVHREYMRDSFDKELTSRSAVRFLAEIDGVLVGDLGVRVAGGVAELGMMVRDGHRGQGIGSALMDACIEWAREAGAHKVALQVWPHNEAALALYRKYGFEIEGRLVRHYRRRNGELWDAIPMGLLLDRD